MYIPAGTWTITTTPIIYDNTTVIGDGGATILYIANGANVSALTNEHWATDEITEPWNVNINIHNLAVDGNRANNAGESYGGISIKACRGQRIHNCYVHDVRGFAGIYAVGMNDGTDPSSKVSVRGNRVINCTDVADAGTVGGGIYFSASQVYNSEIAFNYIEDCRGRGIFTEDYAKNVQIIGNAVRGGTTFTNQIGIDLNYPTNVTVIGNIVYEVNSHGIQIGSGNNNKLIGNTIYKCTLSGIVLGTASYNTIIGNHSYNNSQTGTNSGIYLHTSSTHNIIKGNHCYDNQTPKTQYQGIAEENSNSDYNIIEGNMVAGNKTREMYIQGVNTQEKNNLGYSKVTGWEVVEDTWTYASATTITVPSGATSKYRKGDKIKLTQTTVKYFSIVTVADTLLTVTGGTDYTVANAAITLNYYSHQASPLGFPGWFNATAPTFGVANYDDGAGGQPTTTLNKMKIDGNQCTVRYKGSGVKATTNVYINFNPATGYPAIANGTQDLSLGVALLNLSAAYQTLIVQYSSASSVYMITTANVADDTTVTALSFILNYEI